MPRGGRRQGRLGAQYSNRSDLQNGARQLPVQTGPSQQYGRRAQLERAQQQLPVGPPPATALLANEPAPPAGPGPGELGDPLRETERPGEPLTAGAALGAGPGPEVLPAGDDRAAELLRAMYATFASEDLRELIEELDAEAFG